jgi:hypothetical protein
MTLKEFLEQIDEIVKANPDKDVLALDVVYARDDEGNGYGNVHFSPSLGNMKYLEFSSSDSEFKDETNAICIN